MAEKKTRIIAVDELEWQDASARTGLPEGVRLKLFAEDEGEGITDALVHFPPGYVEPRHTHTSWHSCFLVEGRWIVEGKELTPGSYMFGPAGPDQPHGPFQSPEGSLVFVSSGTTGDMTHEWDRDAPLTASGERTPGNRTRIVHVDELEWQDGSKLMTLPRGARMKIFAEDEETGRTDALIEFPPGYVEPRHTHAASHSGCLLRGDWIVEGKLLEPGGYFYGPAGEDQPHGPFVSPQGTHILISFRGGTGRGIEHHWNDGR